MCRIRDCADCVQALLLALVTLVLPALALARWCKLRARSTVAALPFVAEAAGEMAELKMEMEVEVWRLLL